MSLGETIITSELFFIAWMLVGIFMFGIGNKR